MLEVIIYSVGLGLFLPFFAGTVFFLLIETSITKNIKSAIILDLGVILSDVVYIILVFIGISTYGNDELRETITKYPILYIIGGVVIMAYGLYSFLDKKSVLNTRIVTKKYSKLFIKGFILNFVNITVPFFWITIIGTIGHKFDFDNFKIHSSLIIILVVYFLVDLVKIIFFNKIGHRLKLRNILYIKKAIGIILAIIGIYLVSKGIF